MLIPYKLIYYKENIAIKNNKLIFHHHWNFKNKTSLNNSRLYNLEKEMAHQELEAWEIADHLLVQTTFWITQHQLMIWRKKVVKMDKEFLHQKKKLLKHLQIHSKKYYHDLITQINQKIKVWIMDNRAQQVVQVEAVLLIRKAHQ